MQLPFEAAHLHCFHLNKGTLLNTPNINEAEVSRFFKHAFLIDGQTISFEPLSDQHPLFWICAPLAVDMICSDNFRNKAIFDAGRDKIDWQEAFEGLVSQVAELVSVNEDGWDRMLASMQDHLSVHLNESMGYFLALAREKRENFVMESDNLSDEALDNYRKKEAMH